MRKEQMLGLFKWAIAVLILFGCTNKKERLHSEFVYVCNQFQGAIDLSEGKVDISVSYEMFGKIEKHASEIHNLISPIFITEVPPREKAH